LHLFAHKNLKHDRPPTSGWCMILDIDPLRAPDLVARLRLIGKHSHSSIPYGFSDPRREWFNDLGAFNHQPLGEGLTCSSFVLAALEDAGVSIADLDSWTDRPDDNEQRDQWIARYAERRQAWEGNLAAHFDAIATNRAGLRCRLMEMLGAASSPYFPADFTRAKARGRVLERCAEGTAWVSMKDEG
jgi:hypothetical protein